MCEEDQEDGTKNKRAAMSVARDSAMRGNPICGAFFVFMDLVRQYLIGAFEADTYDYDYEDDCDECMPY